MLSSRRHYEGGHLCSAMEHSLVFLCLMALTVLGNTGLSFCSCPSASGPFSGTHCPTSSPSVTAGAQVGPILQLVMLTLTAPEVQCLQGFSLKNTTDKFVLGEHFVGRYADDDTTSVPHQTSLRGLSTLWRLRPISATLTAVCRWPFISIISSIFIRWTLPAYRRAVFSHSLIYSLFHYKHTESYSIQWVIIQHSISMPELSTFGQQEPLFGV